MLLKRRAKAAVKLSDVSAGAERFQAGASAGVRVFLWLGLLFMVAETIANIVRLDLWSLPLSAYFVCVYAMLLRRKVWQWRRPATSFWTWVTRPRSLAVIGVGLACFGLDRVDDVRRQGAVRSLAPVLSVFVMFAACYLLSIPVTWIVLKHGRRRGQGPSVGP